MTTTTDWEELVTTSHLDTVTKIKWLLEEEDYEEAREGIKTLEEIMAKSERKALESQLVRLMWHIIKWNYQIINVLGVGSGLSLMLETK